MSKEIGSAHNNLFQNILGREDMARDFVRYYMPAEIVGDLDLDTLEVASESYVSDDLRESLSDIVLSLQLRNGDPAEIYILMEHKSGLHKGTRRDKACLVSTNGCRSKGSGKESKTSSKRRRDRADHSRNLTERRL